MASTLAVAVAVHNEQLRLPVLIVSLRAQTAADVPVVFVDNGSADASAALIRECREVKCGRWFCVQEKRVGKAIAMAAAAEYCADEIEAQYVCFLDADSHCRDDRWVERSARAVAERNPMLGFVYSPVAYCGLERAPVFADAYQAYESVLHHVTRNAFSFAYASGAVYAVDLLRHFFRAAEPVAEQGFRLSLLALREGRLGCLNPGVVASSGRRILVNRANLRRWCFYDRDFYGCKDINDTTKLDLDAPRSAPDLDPSEVGLFFERQALKIATRNLACTALFDSTGTVASRVSAAFAVDLHPLIEELRPNLDVECIFGPALDDLLRDIAALPITIALARRLETFMREEYRSADRSNPVEGVWPTGTEETVCSSRRVSWLRSD